MHFAFIRPYLFSVAGANALCEKRGERARLFINDNRSFDVDRFTNCIVQRTMLGQPPVHVNDLSITVYKRKRSLTK